MRNTLTDVITAARCVLREHGLENCSMRRVAAELGVQAGALYHHVPNKQTLLALLADQIVLPVLRASHTDPATLCRALRAELLSIRDGAEVVATATAFRLGTSALEQQLANLVGQHGARTLLLYTYSHAQATQLHLTAAALGALPPGSAAAHSAAALDDSYEHGLGIILAGIRQRETPGKAAEN